MKRDRWQQISRILQEALALPDGEREAFLAQACAHDESLRHEVDSLLSFHASGDGFLETPGVVIGELATLTGRRLGVYQIQDLLGVGGMGEVYRAHDTKLERDVAIKVIPDVFTKHPERIARFEREARVLASLNHPHIGAIYGLEEADGVHGLVLELIEGETLRDRIVTARALPLPIALAIAQQIAEALDAAHEKGIVHRDLNPANIILEGVPGAPAQTFGGVNVKLLDFGLAKLSGARDPSESGSTGSGRAATHAGAILGTTAYMSPEQARGQPVDKRTDIWAFGCVLYEVLTGVPAFLGATPGDTLAGVLEREPNWDLLPASTPAPIRRLLLRCLEKDARRRIRDIGDVRIEIDDALGGGTAGIDRSSQAGSASNRASQVMVSRTTLALAAAGLVGLLAVAGGLWWANARRAVLTQYQFSLSPPAGMHFVSLEAGGPAAISPDGETLAFVAADRSGESSIWTRRLSSVDATRLGGTDGGSHPFWSPDSRFIGFFTPGRLVRIALAGGPPQILAEAPHGRGGTWSKDGVILFTPDFTAGLYRTTSEGRRVEQITAPDFSRRETSHRWPSFLPDGQRFLFLVRSDRPEVQGLYLGSLGSKELTRLLSIPSGAVYAAALDTGGGYLVFAQQGLLTSQPFSPATGRLSGDASTIARLPTPPEDTSVAPASASASGLLVYEGGTLSRQTMAWVDRAGKELGVVSAEGQFRNPRLSPDRRKVAIEKLEFQTGLGSIWLFDLDRDLQQRLTIQEGAFSPVWSPDGKSMLFVSYRGTQWDLIRRSTSDESDTQVLRTSTVQAATDWSKDGQWIIFQEKGAGTNDAWDIGALEVATGKTRKLVSSAHDERQGQLSPDSSWLAYTSNQSGQDQVYLQRFPGATPILRVSATGGAQPKWRPDGRELFYLAPNHDLMSVTVDMKSTPPSLSSNRLLFRANVAMPTGIFGIASYDIDSEGARFLIQAPPQIESIPQQINVIVNWMTGRGAN